MIATIKLKTKQGAFNRAYRGIMSQGGPSVATEARSWLDCLYAGPEGRACAVGHLIDSVEERQNLDAQECTGIGILVVMRKVSTSLDTEFLRELQRAHDIAAEASWECLDDADETDLDEFTGAYHKAMAKVAERHGLTMPENAA